MRTLKYTYTIKFTDLKDWRKKNKTDNLLENIFQSVENIVETVVKSSECEFRSKNYC